MRVSHIWVVKGHLADSTMFGWSGNTTENTIESVFDKISILKKEYGKNFVHFDRKNTLEEKIMHYHRSYSAGAHPSFILVKHSRNLLWEERRASVDISFCSVFTQYWVKDRWYWTENFARNKRVKLHRNGKPTHTFLSNRNEIPSAKSLPCAHYLESNIKDNDIEKIFQNNSVLCLCVGEFNFATAVKSQHHN